MQPILSRAEVRLERAKDSLFRNHEGLRRRESFERSAEVLKFVTGNRLIAVYSIVLRSHNRNTYSSVFIVVADVICVFIPSPCKMC
jgi:hypothetical protein